jgi:hypothetical protein
MQQHKFIHTSSIRLRNFWKSTLTRNYLRPNTLRVFIVRWVTEVIAVRTCSSYCVKWERLAAILLRKTESLLLASRKSSSQDSKYYKDVRMWPDCNWPWNGPTMETDFDVEVSKVYAIFVFCRCLKCRAIISDHFLKTLIVCSLFSDAFFRSVNYIAGVSN